MTGLTLSLIAMGGAYLFAAAFYAILGELRDGRRHHRSLAGFCGALSVYTWGVALSFEAASPAEAASAQVLSMVGFVAALALGTEHALELADGPPRAARLQRLFAALAIALVLSGLFFDPAEVDASSRVAGRPLAALSVWGMLALGPIAGVAFFAVRGMLLTAREKPDLRVAAGLLGLSAVASLIDLGNRALEQHADWELGPYGALFGVLGFTWVSIGRIREVDERLAAREAALARSHDEMRTTQAQLLRKEQLAAIGELSAVIAHEVRNPLAIIKNAVSGLRRDTLREEDGETLLSILDEETDRLDRLIDDLLAYARPISADRGPVDLKSLVAHAVELAAGGNPEIAQIEVELDLEGPIDEVDGDEALLRHALINIVDNALQAMPDGGTLTVSVRHATVEGRPCVAIDFHDTGEGMDTSVRSRAVDPFFTTRQTGTGLGLAIVERVARAHGGWVELESRHGQGTTVSLFVPKERSSSAPAAS